MKLSLKIWLVLLLCTLLVVLMELQKKVQQPAEVPVPVPPQAEAVVPEEPVHRQSPHVGETFTYDVKMGPVRLGMSELQYLPDEERDGRWLQVMRFSTDLARFKDTEMIYSDPDTFLPVMVTRDIANWFSKEKITEYYDQQDYTLRIVSHEDGTDEETLITCEAPIQHPILLPFYVRDHGVFTVGETFNVTLPKRTFTMKLTEIKEVTVPAGNFQAYQFESDPRQIVIWLSADDKRLPLKIEGSGVLNYVLLLRTVSREAS